VGTVNRRSNVVYESVEVTERFAGCTCKAAEDDISGHEYLSGNTGLCDCFEVFLGE